MKAQIATIALFLIFLLSLAAEEVQAGRVRLNLQPHTGHFVLSSRFDTSEYVPLLYGEDPRTTRFSLNLNNRVMHLGSGSDFDREVETIPGGLRIIWDSVRVQVVQDLRLIRSERATEPDGLHIRLQIANKSEETILIGVRVLFDTWLGEASSRHFYLADGTRINNETRIAENFPAYLVSPKDGNRSNGLQLMVSGPGLSRPEALIFANWKRLFDTSWQYSVNTQRTFSYPPFSINDSAVQYVYDQKPLAVGESREIHLAMGYYSGSTFRVESYRPDDVLPAHSSRLRRESDQNSSATAIRSDLVTVRDIIGQLNRLLVSDTPVDEEQIRRLEQIIRGLEADNF